MIVKKKKGRKWKRPMIPQYNLTTECQYELGLVENFLHDP